ncbi:MAG: HAD hydrolase family protein [Deltaproteobacteria bacterium]|nr:HAD hydrolase family protein [Deltaproteobacteria bacterium]
MDRSLSEKLKKIVLLILDVDGVLTDGKIIIDDLGNESKNFHVRDGHGLKLLMRGGVDVMLLTGRTSQVVKYRADELGIRDVYQGVKDKGKVLREILGEKGLSGECIAYMGDDVVDIPAFRMVGFSVAVADAPGYVKDQADYVTEKKGGTGAVREICEMILNAQGTWSVATARYEIDGGG